jgi:murein DD-endopeptidase MepM/ murein hydrolase activator NlpD
MTIKFICGDKVQNITISPLTIALSIGLLGTALWGMFIWFDRLVGNYQAHIDQLEESNQNYRTAIAIKEREREQMLALAEDRFDELCRQLEIQDHEISQINSKVGNASKGRKSLQGSRSGSRQAPLALKLKYIKLIEEVGKRDADITDMRVAVNKYRERIQRERERLAARQRLAALSTTPCGWPACGTITSDYGYRIHPIFGYGRFHSGLDIADNYGTPIKATAAGRVSYSGWMQGYGYAVIIDHGQGLQTLYGHCSRLNVNVGQNVTKGQHIADMGSTGNSTGPHVHYEVIKNGSCVSPISYL